jgi:hypothetical protein
MIKVYINKLPKVAEVLEGFADKLEIVNKPSEADIILSDKALGKNDVFILNRDIKLPMLAEDLVASVVLKVRGQKLAKFGLTLKLQERVLEYNQAQVVLTEKELELMKFLITHDRCYKEELLKKIWNYAKDAETNTIEMHISKLRQKLLELDCLEVVIEINSASSFALRLR